jgi:predicted metal-dependent hydrolase
MKHIIINNIPIELEKKRIKNMYLRILPPEGKIHISAPVRMSEAEIQRFVMSKLEWIKEQQEKIIRRHIGDHLNYITGDIIYLWGRKFRLIVLEKENNNQITINEDKLVLTTKSESTPEYRKQMLCDCYRDALHQELPTLIAKWESIIGVESNSYLIRDMKTRWGTCNVQTKKICFNLQLAKKKPKCLEYVVVHELVHLLERSHNHIFKGYMDHFLPHWRTIKKELNGVN